MELSDNLTLEFGIVRPNPTTSEIPTLPLSSALPQSLPASLPQDSNSQASQASQASQVSQDSQDSQDSSPTEVTTSGT